MLKRAGIHFTDSSARGSNHFIKLLKRKEVPSVILPTFKSESFEFSDACRYGFVQPFLVVGRDDNFGIELPHESISFQEIANAIGRSTPVRLIDVDTQSEIMRYTIGDYADYLSDPSAIRKSKILNMISLEFSSSPFCDDVSPPRFVRKIDWVHSVWPLGCIADSNFCRVERYCLIGMAGSYTDFHIDFGGTSVWYHILRGKKRFYFIPPTVENLLIYENWTCSPYQMNTFLGDLVDTCFYFDLTPGNTLIIPSGWIHSVYTPEESIVFGGNFLHSYSILPQLQANEIEQRTKVSKAFTFPQFMTSHYYFLTEMLPHFERFLQDLEIGCNSFDDEFLQSVVSSPFVLKQIPFLLMAVSHWIGEKNSTLHQTSNESVSKVIQLWWVTLEKIAERNSSATTINFLRRMRIEQYSPDFLFKVEWIESIYEAPCKEVLMKGLQILAYNATDYNCWKLHHHQELERKILKRTRDDDEEYGDNGYEEDPLSDDSFSPKRKKEPSESTTKGSNGSEYNSKKKLAIEQKAEIKAVSTASSRSSLLQKLYGKKK
jgi:hypothetical protein